MHTTGLCGIICLQFNEYCHSQCCHLSLLLLLLSLLLMLLLLLLFPLQNTFSTVGADIAAAVPAVSVGVIGVPRHQLCRLGST